jgi:tetratricopeptide (TPR) repeat protein
MDYRYSGRAKESIPHYKRTVDGLKAKFGDKHTETLLTMNKLAMAYWAVGMHNEAISIQEHCLAAWTEKEGTNNANTLVTKSNLASAYASVGRLDESIRLHEETLNVRRNWGTDPRKFNTMHGLAYSYFLADRFDEASDLNLQAWNGRRDKRGPWHRDSMTSLHNLICSLYGASEIAGAAEVPYYTYASYVKAVELARKSAHSLADSVKILDPLEQAQPAMGADLASELGLAGNSDESVETIVHSVKAHGDVRHFLYVSAGCCFKALGKIQESKLAFSKVLSDDGGGNAAPLGEPNEIHRLTAALFLDTITEEKYLASPVADACLKWFYVAQRRDANGDVAAARDAFQHCLDACEERRHHIILKMAHRRVRQLSPTETLNE